jgi:hypothetical protein
MRRVLVTSAAVVGATGCLSLVVNGAVGPADPDRRTPFGPPAATAAGLTPFSGCEELLDWYVDKAMPHVGPYGLEGPVSAYGEGLPVPGSAVAEDVAGRGDAAVSSPTDSQSSSDSGTTVQEAGVDEPDVAKTDGELVVRVVGNQLVVSDVRTADPRELSRLDLPAELHSAELLLADDRVLVLQSGPVGRVQPLPVEPREPVGPSNDLAGPGLPYPGTSGSSRLVEVSIADPSRPEIVADQTFGAATVTARQYDDDGATVRLVLRTTQPTIDWVHPHRGRTASEAKAENKQILRASTIEDWLPTVGTGDERRSLVDCRDVRHPATAGGFGTVSVVSMPAADTTSWRTTAVTAAGHTVYSSPDRLYLATPSGDDETQVHAFALAGADTRYVASGELEGSVRDRWSMDEHDGVLRVAVGHGSSWSADDNGVTTLREDGDRLVQVGSVRGLGPDEEIKAVRWFDDLAVVVTFRQTDPLYTIDLGDPARPRTLGELKIPGFSRYLHPIGDDRLVGIGQDADLDGVTQGAQGAVFDIADLTAPRRLSTLSLGTDSHALAEEDPRAFTWLAASSTALTTVVDHGYGGARVVALRVTPTGGLDEVDSWPLPGWGGSQPRTLPLGDGRVALVTGEVRVVSVG